MDEEIFTSKREREIMEHALGRRHGAARRRGTPDYRNRFVCGDDHDDWNSIQRLVSIGLMQCTISKSANIGGMSVFCVTSKGKAQL